MEDRNLQNRGDVVGDTPKGLGDQAGQVGNSSYLYLSKVNVHNECPRKYYWVHHLWLRPKETPAYYTFGKYFHQIGELALQDNEPEAIRLIRTFDIDEDQKDMLQLMLLPLIEKKRTLIDFELLGTETAVKFPLTAFNSKYFTHWVVKADFVHKDFEGIFVDDLKTTKGYGASVARYYHNSHQTLTYFHVLQSMMPNLLGTKIWVLTKTKNPRCEIETILITQEDHTTADVFMHTSHDAISLTEERGEYPFRMTSCHSQNYGECAYLHLCRAQWMNRSKDYIDEIINTLFRVENPDGHLEMED